ncbi:RpiB/LacA/LacB family sugar-phosphate isomerase [Streptomyces atratus]|uniref:D-erythrulose 4-phosphate isomerase n=1 Tax=Streptomyces atratus TaxID=1893 RepID=A0A1K2EQZ2_STRAR|nr:RpiB/LacA/LacB family sugar-phosphate isomerase [Streptomyces atratus]SFY37510.1 ribose 5-phosphate isomerase B [Streptomyces atratus]
MSAEPNRLRIVVGADDAGRLYKDTLTEDLHASELVASVTDVGVNDEIRGSYSLIALVAARLVADGKADRALLVCHTGLGMAIAANKVQGIRAVTAHDSLSVRASVLSNNAQVLAFGQGVIGLGPARRLTAEWLTHRFDADSSAAVKVRAISVFEHQHQHQPGPLAVLPSEGDS